MAHPPTLQLLEQYCKHAVVNGPTYSIITPFVAFTNGIDRKTGLAEHKFVLKDVSMSRIEGVCFRYRRLEFVTFKNISLVPGEDQGFEIETGQ